MGTEPRRLPMTTCHSCIPPSASHTVMSTQTVAATKYVFIEHFDKLPGDTYY